MTTDSFVDPELLARVRIAPEYVAAKFGLRNHWYPVRLANEVNENKPLAITLLGENILLNRIDGRVYAVKDRCVHRGVRLSRKIECHTKGTITCWYHGFTYRFADGVLCDIVAAQSSTVIGRRRIKTYPVEEAQGLIFVFVGDDDFDPPPLAHDVPPGFLDAEMTVRAQWREVNANWRIGAENGFDSTHIYIHKDSVLVDDAALALPLGLQPQGDHAFQTQVGSNGPSGVFDNFSPDSVIPVFSGTIEGEEVLTGAVDGKNLLPHSISMWLPCVLKVDPWPAHDLTQFEWYVPIDGERHIYLQTLGRRCATDNEVSVFDREFHERWVPAALNGFNDDDVWAREATQPFYADDRGWLEEQLFEPDGNIVAWRNFVARHARGFQRPEHIDPPWRS